MTIHKKIFFVLFVVLGILFLNVNLSLAEEPTAPPIITGINPLIAVQGQPQIEIYGTNLADKIKLISASGQETEIIGSVDNQLTMVTFEVPLDIQPGQYTVTITSSLGTSASPAKLTVNVGGVQFESSQSSKTVSPPTQGLPTDLGQLIQQIFSWSLAILGIAVFVIFFYAGFLWLTAAGNTARVGDAKSKMTNAVFGAILLLSSYLILNTINPDFVENTFNLPGLGKSGTSAGGGEKVPPPADALIKHPNQSAVIAAAKADLAARGVSFANSCGSFAIVKEAASRLSGGGAGLLKKPTGHNCNGYSVDIIAYPDGYIYDVLNDSSDEGTTGKNTPIWHPAGCGPSGGNGTCPDLYVKP